jgi:hypothetical protein
MHLEQGFSTFCRPGATFTLTYRLAGRKVINEGSFLKHNDGLLKVLQNYRYGCEHITLQFSLTK